MKTSSSARLILGLVALASLLALIGHAMATPALADHCGADGAVTPTGGPIGTTFRIEPQLGGDTRVRLYFASQRVSRHLITGPAPVLLFAPDRVGTWTARASLVSAPNCRSSVVFRVFASAPDTATSGSPASTGGVANVFVLAAAGIGAAAAFAVRIRVAERAGFLPRS